MYIYASFLNLIRLKSKKNLKTPLFFIYMAEKDAA
jgi:hypothetical protein